MSSDSGCNTAECCHINEDIMCTNPQGAGLFLTFLTSVPTFLPGVPLSGPYSIAENLYLKCKMLNVK